MIQEAKAELVARTEVALDVLRQAIEVSETDRAALLRAAILLVALKSELQNGSCAVQDPLAVALWNKTTMGPHLPPEAFPLWVALQAFESAPLAAKLN
jgi:hypothetical protein